MRRSETGVGESRPSVKGPSQRRGALGAWALAGLAVLLACPLMLLELGRSAATDPSETLTLATAVHTLERVREGIDGGPDALTDESGPRISTESDEYPGADWPPTEARLAGELLTPYLNDEPKVTRPPGVIWASAVGMAAGAQAGLADTVDGVVLSARGMSVAMGLLAILGVFWAGCSIGSARAAFLAALVYAAHPLLIQHARVAAAPIHHACWTMLGIASALWAVRPLRPAPSVGRQFLGWLICGLAMGAGALASGPGAALTIAGPVLILLLLCPQRISHLLGLLAALLIGALSAMPWLVYVQVRDPEAWRSWFYMTVEAPRWLDLSGVADNPVALGAWVLIAGPWVVWLIVASAQPWSGSSSGSRMRYLLCWAWLLTAVGISFLIPDADHTGRYLPLLPPAVLLVGVLFKHYADLAAEGRYPVLWRVMRWPHLLVITLVSIGLPLLLAGIRVTGRLGVFDGFPLSARLDWPIAAAMGTGLILVTGLSIRWAVRGRPGKAAICWALWSLCLSGWMVGLSVAQSGDNQGVRTEGERLAELVGDTPVYRLSSPGFADVTVDPGVVLYSGLSIPRVASDRITGIVEEIGPVYLLTRSGPNPRGSRVGMHVAELDALELNLRLVTLDSVRERGYVSAPVP